MLGIRNGSVAVLAAGSFLVLGLIVLTAVVGRLENTPVSGRSFVPKAPLHRVVVTGYTADLMEPFISRDGRYLLFNNLNEAPVNTDIFYAERQDDFTWVFRGPVRGVNTPALEGCATMDRAGCLFFVSPRDYPHTFCTIYTGQFKEGDVTNVHVVDSISRQQPGMVNFDVDVSPDGALLVFVDSRFEPGAGPQFATLVMAGWDGRQFTRLPESARILARVNWVGLNYAPTISANKLTLYFTRYDRHSRFHGPQIYRARRLSLAAPFAEPEHVEGLGEYVEGSALGPDERLLYFHRKDGARFDLYAVRVK